MSKHITKHVDAIGFVKEGVSADTFLHCWAGQVQSLSMEHNPDIMLLAARAITHLADVLPASCSSIVRHGAVSVLCGRLLAIEYIDLAEQSLQALEKLSHEHPQVGKWLTAPPSAGIS